MPYHDLNLQHHPSTPSSTTSQTLAFAAELGYTKIALSLSITAKIPTPPPTIPITNLTIPKSLTILTRLNLTISDTAQNHRLASLQPLYNIIALRPTNEKALQLCCSTLQCDIISLDLTQRLPFLLKFKTVSSAFQRGIRFEINYSPGITGGSDAKRNVIAGATALIRATRGRGIILSSETSSALGLRGPHDVINLACVWGLSQERGKEGVCEEVEKVVRLARLRRETYRGVVGVVDDGRGEAKPTTTAEGGEAVQVRSTATKRKGVEVSNQSLNGSPDISDLKRKASSTSLNNTSSNTITTTASPDPEKPLSKREQKRRAKKARLEANTTANTLAAKSNAESSKSKSNDAANVFPIQHEALSTSARNNSTVKKS